MRPVGLSRHSDEAVADVMTRKSARRLTTILYADAVGFGRAMAKNEDVAYARLKHYRDLMKARFDQYGGRLVNTWGDAVIAEFASVVEAVRCSVEIQDAVASDSAMSADGESMAFRIGINLGDVMVDGDDLYGDGVNVAARLEAMAPPGGVLVSETVYEFAHKQLAIAFDYGGEKSGKSGEDAIAVYAVRTGGSNAPVFQDGASDVEDGEMPRGSVSEDPSKGISGAIDWLRNQPRRIQGAFAIIAFLFFINVMTTALMPPWFLYPAAVFSLYIFLTYKRDA